MRCWLLRETGAYILKLALGATLTRRTASHLASASNGGHLRSGVEGRPRLVEHASGLDGLAGERFSHIFCMEVLEHLDDPDLAEALDGERGLAGAAAGAGVVAVGAARVGAATSDTVTVRPVDPAVTVPR